MGKRKPNKEQRNKQRAHDADIFNRAFNMAWHMGYERGQADKERELLIGLRQEVNKVSLRGQ
jgi:cation transport regulator ChaB